MTQMYKDMKALTAHGVFSAEMSTPKVSHIPKYAQSLGNVKMIHIVAALDGRVSRHLGSVGEMLQVF